MQAQAVRALRSAAEKGESIGGELALTVLRCEAGDLPEVCAAANRMRQRYFGNQLHHCSILNAKCGACSEDCAFCAQSAHHHTAIDVHALCDQAAMQAARAEVRTLPVERFGIVTSGEGVTPDGLSQVCQALQTANREGPAWCASLGRLNAGALQALKVAGLERFHHNLETAESFFPSICSTHTYQDRLVMVRRVKEAGLQVCSGGIFGMGESDEQRVELALALAREQVDSIPLNFLIPIAGTRLADRQPLRPLECLRIIAMFRMVNPPAEIKIGAGRIHLRDLQAMVFYAGATGIMIGRLLTVAGREVALDLQMLADLELDTRPGT